MPSTSTTRHVRSAGDRCASRSPTSSRPSVEWDRYDWPSSAACRPSCGPGRERESSSPVVLGVGEVGGVVAVADRADARRGRTRRRADRAAPSARGVAPGSRITTRRAGRSTASIAARSVTGGGPGRGSARHAPSCSRVVGQRARSTVEAAVALELGERVLGEDPEDAVDASGVEAEQGEEHLQLGDVVAALERTVEVEESVAQSPAGLDQRRQVSRRGSPEMARPRSRWKASMRATVVRRRGLARVRPRRGRRDARGARARAAGVAGRRPSRVTYDR